MQYIINKYTKQQMQEQFIEMYGEESTDMLEHKCCGLDFTNVYTATVKHDDGTETDSFVWVVVREDALGEEYADMCLYGEILCDCGGLYVGSALLKLMQLAETYDEELFEQ